VTNRETEKIKHSSNLSPGFPRFSSIIHKHDDPPSFVTLQTSWQDFSSVAKGLKRVHVLPSTPLAALLRLAWLERLVFPDCMKWVVWGALVYRHGGLFHLTGPGRAGRKWRNKRVQRRWKEEVTGSRKRELVRRKFEWSEVWEEIDIIDIEGIPW